MSLSRLSKKNYIRFVAYVKYLNLPEKKMLDVQKCSKSVRSLLTQTGG